MVYIMTNTTQCLKCNSNDAILINLPNYCKLIGKDFEVMETDVETSKTFLAEKILNRPFADHKRDQILTK